MGPISCPETSVKDYHSTLSNIPEERIAHLLLNKPVSTLATEPVLLILSAGIKPIPLVFAYDFSSLMRVTGGSHNI
jgi:hypothetical protein